MVDLHDRLLDPLQSRPGKWLVRCWWAFWLLGGVVGEIVLASAMPSGEGATGASRLGIMSWEAIAAGIVVADAILAIVVVRQIQRLSDARLVACNGDPNRAIELVVASQRRSVTGIPFLVAAVVIVAIAAPTGFVFAQASAAPSWTQFQAPDGAFTVSMPSQPLEKPIPVHLSGTLTVSGDTFRSASNENLVFQVTYDDYPTGTLIAMGPATVYRSMDQADLGITIDATTDISISGKPAQELQAHKGTLLLIARYLVSGDRVYVIEADFTQANAGSPDIERFLNSSP
jgi:hypothetical protein